MKLINVQKTRDLSKSELIKAGASDARAMSDAGMIDVLEMLVMARKAIEYFSSYTSELESEVRGMLPSHSITVLGSNLSLGSTGDRIDYDQDDIYADLKNTMALRVDLLKTAKKMNEPIFDGSGIEVPSLPLKSPSREILKVKL